MPRTRVGEVELYYEVHGGGGPPLLLISGTGVSGEHWKLRQVPAFAPRFRTVLFDLRGTGRSDRPEGPYATRQFAADAVALLDAIGIAEPAHVLGHSMGGRVAQWVALDHPWRVRSLILAASGPGRMRPDQSFTRGIPVVTAEDLARFGWPGAGERQQSGRFMFVSAAPDLVERFAACRRGEFGTDLHSYLLHVQARQEHQTAELLDRIAAPTLVVVGEEDTVAHGGPSHMETSRHLAEHIPGARFAVVPGGAHGFLVECADEANRVILEFLAEH
jgi:pimeloyl-ACP methyl ester carboxylesterase